MESKKRIIVISICIVVNFIFLSFNVFATTGNPTFSNNITNNTIPKINEDVQFNITWSPQTPAGTLSSCVFSWDNGTAAFINDTTISLSVGAGQNVTCSHNKTIQRVRGTTMQWKFFANQVGGAWNETPTYSLIVADTAVTTPSLTSPSNNSNLTSIPVNLQYSSTDADADTITYFIYINTTLNGTTTSTTFNFNGTNGTYLWNVMASTATVNSSNSTTQQFSLDTGTPSLTRTIINFDYSTSPNGSILLDPLVNVSETITINPDANFTTATVNFTGRNNITHQFGSSVRRYTFRNASDALWSSENTRKDDIVLGTCQFGCDYKQFSGGSTVAPTANSSVMNSTLPDCRSTTYSDTTKQINNDGTTTIPNPYICFQLRNGINLTAYVDNVSSPTGILTFTYGVNFTYPSNITIDTGNDGSFDYSNLSNITNTTVVDLNVSAFNQYLITNCRGGDDNCKIPINFSAKIGGIYSFNNINLIISDIRAPRWSANATNASTTQSAVIGEVIQFNVTLKDGFNLSHYIFSWNDTGSFINDSAVNITGYTNITISLNKTITAVGTKAIGWRIYVNDTTNQINSTNLFEFKVNNTRPIAANISFPINNTYRNLSWINITFNSTDLDNDTITFTLYAGTETDPINAISNSTNGFFNWTGLNETTYFFKALTHDTQLPATSNSSTFNFTVDTIKPGLNLTSPSSGSSNSKSAVTINTNITEAHLDACWFNLTKTASGDLEGAANRTATCNTSFNFATDLAINYTLHFFVLDLAGNQNESHVNFTTEAGGGVGGGGGGGGGGGAGAETTVIVQQPATGCGNNICDETESPRSCQRDCPINLDALLSGEALQTAWFAKFIIYGFGGLILFIIVRRQVILEASK